LAALPEKFFKFMPVRLAFFNPLRGDHVLNPYDKLTIETPEQIALDLPLAGIGSRALAFAFDILLQIGAFFIIVSVGFFLVIFSRSLATSAIGGVFINFVPLIMVLAIFLVHWGYFIFFEIRWNGQTPGKRKIQIRVINESGRPITVMEAVARNLLRPIDSIGSYAVGLICMIMNKQHKRLGDYVAGTLVVYDKPQSRAHTIWNTGKTSAKEISGPVRISPEELALIEAWLNRRSALNAGVRRETAARIASAIRKRTGIEPEDGQSVEIFLESLARKARNTAGYR
jgi:uncharacterized RDD family membrane protein YckC